MALFEGIDFYDLDSLFSEEERMVRDTIREWVDTTLMPIIGDAYIRREFPTQLIPELGELGVLGANLPEEYGCAGLNNVSYGLIMQELERGDSGIRSFVSVQGALVMYPIFAFGSEEHRGEWLPKLATGEAIGCFGLTEPDYGSNPAGMITRAEKTTDGWRLNGSKMWITNGSMADVAVVWAQTGELGDVKGIRGFVVPTDTPGFSAKDQRVDIVRAFVRIDRLEIGHVPHRMVLDENAVPAQKATSFARDVRSHIAVCTLGERDLLWRHRTSVLHPTEVIGDELALRDLREHVGKPNLLNLLAANRLIEHDTLLRIRERLVKARHRGTNNPPRDPVAGLRQTHKRALQTSSPRHERAVGKFDILEDELTRVRSE